MKVKQLLFMFTAVLIIFSGLGCMEEKLNATESLNKTISAIDDVTSYSYNMTSQLDYFFSNQFSLSTKYKFSVKAIIEPYAAEIDLSIDMHGQEMDMKLYLVDDYYYFYIPEVGWSRQDLDDMHLLSLINPSQFKMIEMLKTVEPDLISSYSSGEDLNLRYMEQDGVFTNHIKLVFLEQVIQELVSDVNQEVLVSNFTFENLVYDLTIDSKSFLPEKEIMQYQLLLELMDEEIIIYNTSAITYQEYNTFDSISVPEEVIDEAIPYE